MRQDMGCGRDKEEEAQAVGHIESGILPDLDIYGVGRTGSFKRRRTYIQSGIKNKTPRRDAHGVGGTTEL